MQITKIHSFLVKPQKGTQTQESARGTDVPMTGKLYEMLSGVFLNAENECIFEITFCPNDEGKQVNACRDMILAYIKDPTNDTAENLAHRLQSLTDQRSGLGLLFIILGSDGEKHKVVVSRFPADHGVLADEENDKISIKFIERVFMKSSRFYKSAVYQGASFDNDFWVGKAVDKQMIGGTIANYWIREFLYSDLSTPGIRGSRWIGNAFKEAYNEATDPQIKDEILAALRLAGPLNGKVVDSQTLLTQLNLSEETKSAIISKVPVAGRTEFFTFDAEETRKIAAFKTIGLDTGVRLTASASQFDDLISQTTEENGKTAFATSGIIVDERIRKANK